MRAPSDIFYHLFSTHATLVTLLSGYYLGTSVVPDGENSPDKSVIIFDTAGRPDGRIMRTGERIEHPGIMIHVRGLEYFEAWSTANAIALFLDARQRESIAIASDEVYVLHNVTRTPIIPVGLETVSDRRRHLITINMTITLSEET